MQYESYECIDHIIIPTKYKQIDKIYLRIIAQTEFDILDQLHSYIDKFTLKINTFDFDVVHCEYLIIRQMLTGKNNSCFLEIPLFNYPIPTNTDFIKNIELITTFKHNTVSNLMISFLIFYSNYDDDIIIDIEI